MKTIEISKKHTGINYFLPTCEQGQVIYIESEYNKKLNKFIRNNYESLKSDFAEKGP